MKGIIENSYGRVFKGGLKAVNPIKKRIIKTECEVHRFINNQAVTVLKNDGYLSAYDLMSQYIDDINAGAVWADQDFKSSSHFYNPDSQKGLYGSSNAHREIMSYYAMALNKYYQGDVNTAMFYLGASCHIIQDMTVPQHVNVKLLDSHRRYEQWIIKTYKEHDAFKIFENGIYFDTIPEFIEHNSRNSIEAYKKHKDEENRHVRFFNITSVILTLAQRSTAGAMQKFYCDIEKMKPYIEKKQKKMEMASIVGAH